MIRKYNVSILDDTYSLISDEPENHVRHAVELVDTCMRQLASKSSDIDIKKIAVLVAIQLASKMINSQNDTHDIHASIDKLVQQIDDQLVDAYN